MSEALDRSGKKSNKRRPDLDTVYSINPDGSRNFMHPADFRGKWQSRKNVIWIVLVLIYAGLPWVQIGGRPALHVDLPARNAYLFGTSFTNQDVYLLFFLVTGLGFALFVATALWSRVWCGFACPQTVFMEGVFRRIERWIEGPRLQRIRRNLGPNSPDKVWRKLLKHILFLILSAAIAHVFLSYFLPARELAGALLESPANHPSAFFWTMFWTAIMYFNYSWFREQTCLIICPYGRLQSALIDEDSIIIGYDAHRGEPRSKGKDSGGDCVDCFRCVDVCPTGIDIRNGLQMECIGCTNCIDACDEVMRRIDKPDGLVRFDSKRGFAGEQRRPLLRPRVLVYAFLALLGLAAAGWSVGGREIFQANALRARGMPYVLEGERIRNLFNLHIQNKSDGPASYAIAGVEDGDRPVEFIIAQTVIRLGGMEDAELPVFAYLPRENYREPFPVFVTVTDSVSGKIKQVEIVFRGP